jgi:hypothetical protein
MSINHIFFRCVHPGDLSSAKLAVDLSREAAQAFREIGDRGDVHLLQLALDRMKESGRSLGRELCEIVALELEELGADIEQEIVHSGEAVSSQPSGLSKIFDELDIKCVCGKVITFTALEGWLHLDSSKRCFEHFEGVATPRKLSDNERTSIAQSLADGFIESGVSA